MTDEQRNTFLQAEVARMANTEDMQAAINAFNAETNNTYMKGTPEDRNRGPGPEKRGDRGRRRTERRIERGGGNGGETVRSPLGRRPYSRPHGQGPGVAGDLAPAQRRG